MIWVVFAHIGLPTLFAFALLAFSAASSRGAPTWDLVPDVAFELTILSAGATAAIFENPTVEATYGGHAAIVAMGVVAVDLILGAFIVSLRRYVFIPKTHRLAWSTLTLGLGAMALFVTSLSLWYGTYRSFF